MYIPDKMKINRFREVRIPSKGSMFNTGRYMTLPTQYGGEEEAADMGKNKDQITGAAILEMQEQFNKQREHEAE